MFTARELGEPWFVESDYEQVSARVTAEKDLVYREPGENNAKARKRRRDRREAAKHEPPVEGTRVTLWKVPYDPMEVHGQRDDVRMPSMPEHTCCEPPDKKGRVYPVCGMSPLACSGHYWY